MPHTTKEPILAVFGVGSLTQQTGSTPPPGDPYNEEYLSTLKPDRNMVAIVKHYMTMKNASLIFCTGRPKSTFRTSWRWLNVHLGLAASGKRATLVCRPDDVPDEQVAAGKVHEVVQALRRLGTKPSEAFIYDDDLSNLRLFESLRPMVRHLHLFKVEDGLASAWSL